MPRLRFRIWSLLSLAATPVLGQDPSHQGVSYALPAGWVSGEQAGRFILVPNGASKDVAVVVTLSAAERLDGKPFADWLTARMATDLNANAKVLQASPVQAGTSGALQTLSTGRTVQDAGGRVLLQIYYAITDGERGATAMLVATSEAAVTSYTPPIQSLFQSLRFSEPSASAPSVAPAPAPAVAPAAGSGPPAAGEARTFQNVIYTVPRGWSSKENAGGVDLSPASALQGDESLTLVILPGMTATDLSRGFETTWQEVCAMLKAQSMVTVNHTSYDLEPVGRSSSGWEFLKGNGGARTAGQQFDITLFLAKVGDRIERVAVIARTFRVNLTTTNAGLNPRFSGVIDEFLFGLRFANWKEPARSAPSLTGGPITGAWLGISMIGGKLTTASAVFLADGSAWFSKGFPTYGLADVKPRIESGADPSRWGTYTFHNGAGELVTGRGKVPLRLDGDVLVLVTTGTPHRFIRSHPPAGNRLNGRYCLGEGGCITLSADGHFQDEGAARVLEHAVYPYPLTPDRGQGSYEIRDYTLILRYDSGPEVRIAFPGFTERDAASSSPAAIILSFNFDQLRKQ
jgi:hypothetical protein